MRPSWMVPLVVLILALLAASGLESYQDEEEADNLRPVTLLPPPGIQVAHSSNPVDEEEEQQQQQSLDSDDPPQDHGGYDDAADDAAAANDGPRAMERNLDYGESSLDSAGAADIDDDDDGGADGANLDDYDRSARSSSEGDTDEEQEDPVASDAHPSEDDMEDAGDRDAPALMRRRSPVRRALAWKSGLSDREIAVIKSTWEFVRQDTVTSGLKLFRGLFLRFPQYLKLFKFTDLDLSSIEAMRKNKKLVNHVTKVITTVSFVVDTLGDDARTQERITALTNLIKAHKKRQVGYEQFKNLGGVVIDTVVSINEAAGAPDERIQEAIPAWTKFYASILSLVKKQAG